MELVVTPQTLWKLGTLERVELGTPIVLVADVVNGAAESRYSALRVPGAAAGYQVTAGRTLWLTKVTLSTEQVNVRWMLGSGTADAGDSQVAAPAGAVSEDSRADGVPNHLPVLVSQQVYSYDILVSIAAARFPFVRGITASTNVRILALGVEV